MLIRYVGPHDRVSVGMRVAERNGDPIEVPDELARDLLKQESNWRPVPPETPDKRSK